MAGYRPWTGHGHALGTPFDILATSHKMNRMIMTILLLLAGLACFLLFYRSIDFFDKI